MKPPRPDTVRAAYLAEYHDIWRCFYDGACPTGEMRDQALAALQRQYPEQEEPA